MSKPTDPEHLIFEVNGNWDGETGGKLTATHSGYEVPFDTPTDWGGNSRALCPDELFMSSVAGCITTTFCYFCRKMKFQPIEFKIRAAGNVDFVQTLRAYRLTKVVITAEMLVEEGEERIGEKCFELSVEYCHITKSIDTCIPIEVKNLSMQTKAI